MKAFVFTVLASCLIVTSGALAGDSENKIAVKVFLQGLDGKFRGRGETVMEINQSQERVSCRLDNEFSDGANILNVSGVCATTQGKTKIKGKLELIEDKISGSFLPSFRNSEITQSKNVYQDGELILSTSVVNKATGSLTRVRQIITSNKKGGFSAVFQKFDNASRSYQSTGHVEFSPAGN